MGKNFDFKLNEKGVRELLRSQEAMNVCRKYADRALQKLGDGYEVTTCVGRNRVNAEVGATTFKTRKKNHDENTILKAVRG